MKRRAASGGAGVQQSAAVVSPQQARAARPSTLHFSSNRDAVVQPSDAMTFVSSHPQALNVASSGKIRAYVDKTLDALKVSSISMVLCRNRMMSHSACTMYSRIL